MFSAWYSVHGVFDFFFFWSSFVVVSACVVSFGQSIDATLVTLHGMGLSGLSMDGVTP